MRSLLLCWVYLRAAERDIRRGRNNLPDAGVPESARSEQPRILNLARTPAQFNETTRRPSGRVPPRQQGAYTGCRKSRVSEQLVAILTIRFLGDPILREKGRRVTPEMLRAASTISATCAGAIAPRVRSR